MIIKRISWWKEMCRHLSIFFQKKKKDTAPKNPFINIFICIFFSIFFPLLNCIWGFFCWLFLLKFSCGPLVWLLPVRCHHRWFIPVKRNEMNSGCTETALKSHWNRQWKSIPSVIPPLINGMYKFIASCSENFLELPADTELIS